MENQEPKNESTEKRKSASELLDGIFMDASELLNSEEINNDPKTRKFVESILGETQKAKESIDE